MGFKARMANEKTTKNGSEPLDSGPQTETSGSSPPSALPGTTRQTTSLSLCDLLNVLGALPTDARVAFTAQNELLIRARLPLTPYVQCWQGRGRWVTTSKP